MFTYTSSSYIARFKGPSVFTNTICFMPVWFTISMISTINIITRCFTLYHRWSSHIPIVAFTMETTNCIGTDRKWTTRLLIFTFIYVYANSAFSNKAFLAETLIFNTFGIICAIEVRLTEDVYVNLK